MSEMFQVVVDGQLQPGRSLNEVRSNVASLFKVEASKIDAFFSGKRIVVKEGLPMEKARKYLAALENAGVVAVVEASPEPGQKPRPSSTATENGQNSQASPLFPNHNSAPASASSQAGSLSASVEAKKQTQGEDSQPQASEDSGFVLAQVGATLGEQRPFESAQIDLSHLTLKEAGADLQDSYEQSPSVSIDIRHLSLKEDSGPE